MLALYWQTSLSTCCFILKNDTLTMSASASGVYEEKLQGLLMLQNLTSASSHQSDQVAGQHRVKGRELDFTSSWAEWQPHCQGAIQRDSGNLWRPTLHSLPHQLFTWASYSLSWFLSVLSMPQRAVSTVYTPRPSHFWLVCW